MKVPRNCSISRARPFNLFLCSFPASIVSCNIIHRARDYADYSLLLTVCAADEAGEKEKTGWRRRSSSRTYGGCKRTRRRRSGKSSILENIINHLQLDKSSLFLFWLPASPSPTPCPISNLEMQCHNHSPICLNQVAYYYHKAAAAEADLRSSDKCMSLIYSNSKY